MSKYGGFCGRRYGDVLRCFLKAGWTMKEAHEKTGMFETLRAWERLGPSERKRKREEMDKRRQLSREVHERHRKLWKCMFQDESIPPQR